MRARSRGLHLEKAAARRLAALFPLAIATLATVTLAAPAAALVPIDDFEVGGFFMQGTTSMFQSVAIPSYESHAIWSERSVWLTPGGSESSAWLFDGTALDDRIHYSSSGGGDLRIDYNWGFPMDLTYRGTVEAFVVDLHEIIEGGWIQVAVFDGSTVGASSAFAVVAGVVSFPLADFTDVDLTEARSFSISFGTGGNEGVFEIAEIRFWRANSSVVDYSGLWVAVQTPPIPTPPLSFRAIGEPRALLYIADVAIEDARTPAGAVPSMSSQWQASPSFGGGMAGITFSWDPTAPFEDTSFELSVALSPANGLTPELAFPPEPVIGAQSFSLPCAVLYRDSEGVPVGDSEVRIVFTRGGGQALKFEGVAVTPAPAQEAGLAAFVVSFELDATGDVNESAPLFDIAWMSDWAWPATTDVSDAEGVPASGSGRMTLAAWPSVTRGETEIRASIPFTAGSAIAIHDAAGRLVRRLTTPLGAAAATWDGRDDRGAETASGIYYAAIVDPAGRASTRIVRVR